MESGKLQFDWKQSSEAIALIGLDGEGEESFSLLRRLVSEASTSYPQLSQLRFMHIPLPVSKLERWSYWLAAQVVGQWRDQPVEGCSVANIIDELGLSSAENRASLLKALDTMATDTPLTLQLSMHLQSLRERQRQQKLTPSRREEWLEQETAKVAQWFTQLPPAPSRPFQSPIPASSCLAQLQSNVLALRSKVKHHLQGCFVRLQRPGSRALLQWLSFLAEALESIRTDYEAQRQENLRRENSAWRAYYTLRESPEKHNWGLSRGSHLDWEAILRALAMAYDFKLGAEMYTQAAQLVGELAQETRLYAASVAQVDAMLARLQGWFTEHGSVEPLFVPLLKESLRKQLNPAQLRSELENWVGCGLGHWGALESTKTAALCDQILARTRPLCLEVYTECCRWLLNLDPLDRQTQLDREAQSPAAAGLATVSPNPEKRVSLQVRNADIRDALEVLGRVSGEQVVADESVSGTVSLALDDVSVIEALNTLMVTGNLTYTKSGDVYTFSQHKSADSPATAMAEPNRAEKI